MNTILPTAQTKQPSRDELVYHEIFADGLIHTAAVFGIEPDERFIERVACIAWANGVALVRHDYFLAAKIAQKLAESLEAGRSTSKQLSVEIAPLMTAAGEPYAAIRGYYETTQCTRTLKLQRPFDTDRIRQLVGEAALAGLLSRGLEPAIYQSIKSCIDSCQWEQTFLSSRLIYWASDQGLPLNHPFVELAVFCYKNRPLERNLLCTAIAAAVPEILDHGNPWAVEHWLSAGWKDGLVTAKFAPDVLATVIEEVTEENREFNLMLFKECVVATYLPERKADLSAAFERYLNDHKPYSFSEVEVREANPRLVAWAAYDFAFWMAVISERQDLLTATEEAP